MSNNRPSPLPVCEHGRVDFEQCHECHKISAEIHLAIQPLINEFWSRRDSYLLEHLLYRAYRMGMARTKPEELK